MNLNHPIIKISKQLLPPILLILFKKIMGRHPIKFVKQPSWEVAIQNCEGYDSESLITKTKESAKLVASGLAVYERDSVIFEEIQYSFPLLASLLFIAANNNSLRVIDFGGSFGTTFQQNKKFLGKLEINCEWRIVEQPKITQIGKMEFATKKLSFYNSIDEATKDGYDVMLFSSSLCYIADPYSQIRKTIAINAQYIIIDRTPIHNEENDSFSIQHTPSSIYKASYPIRNFSYAKLIKTLTEHYDLIEEWKSDLQPDPSSVSMGFLFKLKTENHFNN